MKKLTCFLLSLCLLCAMLACSAVPAFAAEKADIEQTYFSSGALTKPEAPYLHANDSYVSIFYEQTPELMKLAEDCQLFRKSNPDLYDDYLTANGANSFSKYIQIDYKFDDNAWASENGDWDAVDGWAFDTGSDEYYPLCFAVSNSHDPIPNDDNTKMDRIYMADLWYYSAADGIFSYLDPYVTRNFDGNYMLDLDRHTFTARIRWYATYEEDGAVKTFFSDWSDAVSIGKNGTQEEATLPKLEAPVLSELSLVKHEDGSVDVEYYIDIHGSAYKANRYHYIFDDCFDSYVLEAQLKKGSGEWVDCYTANASWLTNGFRSCEPTGEMTLALDDDVQLRVRIVCSAFEEEPSPWSNIIGTNAGASADEPNTPGTAPAGEPTLPRDVTTEKAGCKLCGICPIQPLGICLFIWIGIVLAVILVIAIAASASKKKRQGRNRR